MSLVDTVFCEYPLPDNAPEHIKKCPVFQTHDLGEGMGEYILTKDGKLLFKNDICSSLLCKAFGKNVEDIEPFALEYKRKKIELFGSNIRGGRPATKKEKENGETYVYLTDDGSDLIEITYVVQIRNSKVSSIKEKYRKVSPAKKYEKLC
jgi:hypothetical protein